MYHSFLMDIFSVAKPMISYEMEDITARIGDITDCLEGPSATTLLIRFMMSDVMYVMNTPVGTGLLGVEYATPGQQDASFLLPLEILFCKFFSVALSLRLRRNLLRVWLISTLAFATCKKVHAFPAYTLSICL